MSPSYIEFSSGLYFEPPSSLLLATDLRTIHNKAFIDIRLCSGLATPRGELYFATLSPCALIRPTQWRSQNFAPGGTGV